MQTLLDQNLHHFFLKEQQHAHPERNHYASVAYNICKELGTDTLRQVINIFLFSNLENCK